MPLFNQFVKIIGPDNPVGRTMMKTRMWIQTLPMRMKRPQDQESLDFLQTCRRIIPQYSMISVDRLQSLYRLAFDASQNKVQGCIVECGTWNGGAAALLSRASIRGGMHREVWVFDSFEGLPPPTADDPPMVHRSWHKGWCKGDPKMAREVLLSEGTIPEDIHIVKGWFEMTFPGANVGSIALLHVDSDWYDSVRLCLERFYGSVVPGGVIIFDDYHLWGGCKKAVDEFLEKQGLLHELKPSGKTAVFMRRPEMQSMP